MLGLVDLRALARMVDLRSVSADGAWLPQPALFDIQSRAVPMAEVGGSIVGALKEGQQRRVRVRRGANRLVGKDELAKRGIEARLLGRDFRVRKAIWRGTGIGVERSAFDAAAARPEACA